MTERILPCPFCGGKGEVVESPEEIIVRCTNCGAQGSRPSQAVRAHVIMLWNIRVSSSKPDPAVLRDLQNKIRQRLNR